MKHRITNTGRTKKSYRR